MKGNVLIIDDEPILAKSLKLILDDFADAVYTAGNGQEGLEVMRSCEVHCIVCDINMPVMNGMEFIKELRNRGFETPLIFFTGHGDANLLQEAVKYGAFDFIDKPHFMDLEEVVGRALKAGMGPQGQSPALDANEISTLLEEIEDSGHENDGE